MTNQTSTKIHAISDLSVAGKKENGESDTETIRLDLLDFIDSRFTLLRTLI